MRINLIRLVFFIIILATIILTTSCNFLPVGQVVYEKQDDGWYVKYFIASFDKGANQADVDMIKDKINQNIK